MIRSAAFFLIALALGACAANPGELPPGEHAQLERGRDQFGEHIYTGSVATAAGQAPVFRYERRVERGAESVIATHLTLDVATDQVVVLQRATTTPDNTLRSFHQIHRQTGASATVEVAADGSATYRIESIGKTSRREEPAGAPLVVGPTLFGYVIANWDALTSGRALEVRFAAADRGRSYPFELSLAHSDPRRTVIRFTARDWMVRLAMKPMDLEFDTASRRIVRYSGRVPPRLDGREFDAVVDYTHVSAAYR